MSKADPAPSTSTPNRRSMLTFEPAAPVHVLLAKLGKAHAPDGMTAMGERLAMVVVSSSDRNAPSIRRATSGRVHNP